MAQTAAGSSAPGLRCGHCGQPVKLVRKSGHPAVWAHRISLRELGEICYATGLAMNHPAAPRGTEVNGR